MGALSEVQSWMAFFGWTDRGNPGSVKHDAYGKTIAEHGDITWIADVEDACARVERAKIIAEVERRTARPAPDAKHTQDKRGTP